VGGIIASGLRIRITADPDPAFHFNADTDPAFRFNADPDSTYYQSDANL
jgi:hypothetical protein